MRRWPAWGCSTRIWTNWSNGWRARKRTVRALFRWAGAVDSPPRARGWTRRIPTTVRFCRRTRSTTARWPPIFRFRRRGGSCSSITSRRRYLAGRNWRSKSSRRKPWRVAGKPDCVIIVYTTRRSMGATRVGIREFRENLASYLESKTPVAVTRHGATIGIYVPTRPKPRHADLEALRAAGERLQTLIEAAGATEDELVEEFKRLPRERRKKKA